MASTTARKAPAGKAPVKAPRATTARKTSGKKFIPAARRKRKRSHHTGNWDLAVYRVLKQIHPDCGMTTRAVTIMTNFCEDIFDRLMHDAVQIAKMNKKKTINCAEIQTAVRLMLAGELGKYGVGEAAKAVKKYEANKSENTPEAEAGE